MLELRGSLSQDHAGIEGICLAIVSVPGPHSVRETIRTIARNTPGCALAGERP